jgi:DMSO/TMAO reductase YedYZ molybdopterin-dependent catalytic subunit/mono/diheme cytochrome c family protein
MLGAGAITPLSRFFVRNNLPRPDASILANRSAWTVEVEGVNQPRRITLAELQTLPWKTYASVIQCSGNGRKFFAHGPSGSPWGTGAAGCALWTGVRVADVLAHLGGTTLGDGFLTATGGEPLPEGIERDAVVVERAVPLAKGLADAMLVWEMNGEPLPLTHGGPLRLLVPGYFGCNQIKYVARLAVTAQETSAKIQQKGYRYRPIGSKGAPDQPSLWRMPVKSWLNGPGGDGVPILPGAVTLYGVALSGERGIAAVEVSTDGGTTWQAAEFTGPDLGPNAWRTFQLRTTLALGAHMLVSRATDTLGEVQPEARQDNERGYRHNGWADHALRVEVVATLPAAGQQKAVEVPGSPRAPAVLSESAERGKQVFTETASPSCGVCHTLGDANTHGAVGPNLDALGPDLARVEAAVREGVGAMPAFTELTDAQIADVASYVAESTR